MTRDEAAQLLGTTVDASPADIQRAFRTQAWAAHPDHGGTGSGADLTALRNARDALLAPVSTSPPAQPATPSPAPSPSTSSSASTTPRRTRPNPVESNNLAWFVLVGIWATGLIVFAMVVIVAFAVVAGEETEGGPSDEEQCVFIPDNGDVVAFGACTEPGAQRIDSTHTDDRPCPPGTNTLVVIATTWCLRPVS